MAVVVVAAAVVVVVVVGAAVVVVVDAAAAVVVVVVVDAAVVVVVDVAAAVVVVVVAAVVVVVVALRIALASVPIRALRLSTIAFSAKIPHVILLTEKADGALVVVVVVVVPVPTCNVIPYGDTCLFCPVDGPFRQLAATEVKQMERSANKALHDNAETQIL